MMYRCRLCQEVLADEGICLEEDEEGYFDYSFRLYYCVNPDCQLNGIYARGLVPEKTLEFKNKPDETP